MLGEIARLYRRPNGPAQKFQALRKHLGTAVRDYRHVASLFPSSGFTAKTVSRLLPTRCSRVLEYGAGVGSITRELLHRIPQQGAVIAVELNERFVPTLENIGDSRLEICQTKVQELLPEIRTRFRKGVDAVVSGIPFSLIPPAEREAIVLQTRGVLRPGGRFIAYQNSRLLVPLMQKHFDQVKVLFEPRNVFPYFIMVGEVSE